MIRMKYLHFTRLNTVPAALVAAMTATGVHAATADYGVDVGVGYSDNIARGPR
jgi:hypothetical protein